MLVDIVNLYLSIALFLGITFHKQTGLTILALLIIRVVWRLFALYPRPVESLSTMERHAAKLGHLALYLFMLAIPLQEF